MTQLLAKLSNIVPLYSPIYGQAEELPVAVSFYIESISTLSRRHTLNSAIVIQKCWIVVSYMLDAAKHREVNR